MLLTGFNLIHYLLEKGFISYEDFMNEDFSIHMASSRNHGFIVNRNKEDALFVKQVRAFEPDKIETLRAEATCYWLADNEPEYAELKKFLPNYDEDRVYNSDVKKMYKWYNLLIESKVLVNVALANS